MIVGVGSWRGSGATTVAFALAASFAAQGRHPWLIEADPAGGVLAARLPDGSVIAGALEHVAFPDARTDPAARLAEAAGDLLGMRVLGAPGDPFRAWACHAPRHPWAPALRDLDGPVVVDVGRLRGASPVGAVLAQCDALVLVADSDATSIVSTDDWATALGRVAPVDSPMPLDVTRIVVVDTPHAIDRIGRADADAELGDRLAGWFPWEPGAVRSLYDGVPVTDRRFRRSAFVQAALQLADRLATDLGVRATEDAA
ncbi:MAG: hypothetical protein R2743_22460 [Ilumatobacteraceae bacterium]